MGDDDGCSEVALLGLFTGDELSTVPFVGVIVGTCVGTFVALN